MIKEGMTKVSDCQNGRYKEKEKSRRKWSYKIEEDLKIM
jgi:hypothetical protein